MFTNRISGGPYPLATWRAAAGRCMSNLLRRTERNERARRVFNTMDALQYANLLRETIEEYGCPAIFNTDQGSQFTSDVFIKILVDYNIQINMDGKDRALDNIRIERLWRSLKYEDIYLKRYETMKDLKTGINAYFNFYNTARFHQSLDYNVPDEMYKCFQYNELERKKAA